MTDRKGPWPSDFVFSGDSRSYGTKGPLDPSKVISAIGPIPPYTVINWEDRSTIAYVDDFDTAHSIADALNLRTKIQRGVIGTHVPGEAMERATGKYVVDESAHIPGWYDVVVPGPQVTEVVGTSDTKEKAEAIAHALNLGALKPDPTGKHDWLDDKDVALQRQEDYLRKVQAMTNPVPPKDSYRPLDAQGEPEAPEDRIAFLEKQVGDLSGVLGRMSERLDDRKLAARIDVIEHRLDSMDRSVKMLFDDRV